METPEYLRFFDATFEQLLARGHEIAIAVDEDKQKKPVRLEAFQSGGRAPVLLGLTPRHAGVWGKIGKGLRGTVDFVRFLHPDYHDAPALRARMYRKVLPIAFRPLHRLPQLSVRTHSLALRWLARCEDAIPVSPDMMRFLEARSPDAVLVSPLIDAASAQVEVVKAARALGIPVGACIASWDNLTNKGLMRVEPDLVTVWNEAQRKEAVRYHSVPAAKVVVTGAQPFDRWFDRQPSQTREAFAAAVGLPADRPFVIFTGSSGFISETQAEVAVVRRWLTALRAAPDPVVAGLAVLVRPHPYNWRGWVDERLEGLGPVAVWPRGPYNPIAEENRAAYFDSLFYSAAVVGINTSAMVEAAILGKPVLSFVPDEFRGTQEGTLHFRYLLSPNGGPVTMARSDAEHHAQLADVLWRPDEYAARARAFVSWFIRPHGLDRPATPGLVAAIEGLAARGRGPRRQPPVSALLLRAVVLVLSLGTGAVAMAADPKWRGRLRKRASKAIERARKRLRGRETGRRQGTSGERTR